MKKQKKNEGVTLIILVITIVIMSILLATVIYNAQRRNKMSKLDYLYTDLTILEGKYKTYYQQNNYIPVEEKYTGDTSVFEEQKNPNDSENYYIVDIQKLSNVSLKTSGTFIINEKTLSVYYPSGVTVDGITYYTLPSNSNSQLISDQTKAMQLKGISDGSWNEEKKVNCPKLLDGMTPICWTSTGEEIEITGNIEQEWANWYDYEQNNWANAVTKDKDGNITGYWVWIPRYEYKINSTGVASTSEIKVKFIPTSQTIVDEGYDYIHPSFRDGKKNNYKNGEWDEEIPGFWVAKYMAGFQANTTSASDATTVINSTDTVVYSEKTYTGFNPSFVYNALCQELSKEATTTPLISYPVFKPLTYAYNGINASDVYTITKQIDSANNFYGLNNKTADSHMMKNSEWGAVVYLTHSVFGRNKEAVTSNSKNMNNLNSLNIYAVTGYSQDTPNGVEASSTNNMSGVFDLSGGALQRTAGYISNGCDELKSGRSFVGDTNVNTTGYLTLSNKYVTVYPFNNLEDTSNSNWSKYNNLKSETYGYGDAILETSILEGNDTLNSWDGVNLIYPNHGTPFFVRSEICGYTYDTNTIFRYSTSTGAPSYMVGFRAVLIGI